MITTVEELISVLSKYSKNKKVYSNFITQNLKGELVIEPSKNSRRREA